MRRIEKELISLFQIRVKVIEIFIFLSQIGISVLCASLYVFFPYFEIAYNIEIKMIRFFYVSLAFRGDRILLSSQLIFPT